MSRNDEGDDLCPACGKPIPPTRNPSCTCTAADLRDIFARDRAEMSRRLAASEVRSQGLIREAREANRQRASAFGRLRKLGRDDLMEECAGTPDPWGGG